MDNYGMTTIVLRQKAIIQITGMTCHSCVNTIQHNVGDLEGVLSVNVSLSNQEGIVVFVPAKITVETLVGEIEDTGFDASLKSVENLKPEDKTLPTEPTIMQLKESPQLKGLDEGN